MDKELLLSYLKSLQNIMCEHRDYLIELDSVVGDGDLGLTMSDGFTAAYEAVCGKEETDLGKILYNAGKAMSTAVPSTMGTLMASGFMNAGKVMKGKTQLTIGEVVDVFQAYMDGVQNRGKAKVGDKTFLDGLSPAVEAMKSALNQGEEALAVLADKAAQAAEQGFEDTTKLLAIHGRAATRGEASRSLKDPGAAVAMLMMRAFKDIL